MNRDAELVFFVLREILVTKKVNSDFSQYATIILLKIDFYMCYSF